MTSPFVQAVKLEFDFKNGAHVDFGFYSEVALENLIVDITLEQIWRNWSSTRASANSGIRLHSDGTHVELLYQLTNGKLGNLYRSDRLFAGHGPC